MTDENQPMPWRVAEFMRETDQETARTKQRIADQFAAEDALREVSNSKDALEVLVLKLREANQNLVIATFAAQEMQAKAELVAHHQEEFLSMLAHELRNPLAPIVMAAELLGNIASAHPQLPKLHGIISRQAHHMTRLVNDLVDASLISRGKIELQKSALLLSECIDSAVETAQPFIEKHHQHLTIDLPPNPVVVCGDMVRLAQVFSNLLINSTKFTQEYGHISVSAQVLDESVTVTVKDDGMGIPADILPFIFDLFRQGPRSLDRSQGGLGVGLSLVRSIVQMHGGSVEVRSDGVGKGSAFLVSLPIAIEPPLRTRGQTSMATPVRYRRILLIDDNPDANEILKDLLEAEGHIVTSSFDGITGLAMAKANIYDVIVCDIGLPGMDGYEVSRQLHRHPAKSLPCFIALTGYNQPQNRTRAIEAGFDHYLVKPIGIEILMNLISSSNIVAA